MGGTPEEKRHDQPPSSTTPTAAPKSDEAAKKWGTHIMGPPAVPSAHPDNQKATSWNASENQEIYHQHQQQQQQPPYVIYDPVEKPNNNPFVPVIHMFDTWSNKAEFLARNIWHNLKTGPSVTEAVSGKVNLSVKAISKGGFESLFRQTFETDPNEKLKKTFACYFSTTTGPVAGTLYLSTARVAFCSDRPLSFPAPSGQQTWSYYKVNITLAHIETVNPEIKKENPSEKYIQIVTVDGHEFWFMGFVNFEKASHNLTQSVFNIRAQDSAAPPVVGKY